MSATLLPPNATPLERNVEAATWRLNGAGPSGVRALWKADRIPAPLLPWLAWAFNIDAWDSAWDEAKKRAVVAGALALHRVDGTLAAIRRVTELHGGTLTKVVRPPCQLYYGPTPTPAEREAALAVYPRLILRTDHAPFVVSKLATFSRRSYMGRSYAIDLDATRRARPKAVIRDRGTEIECAVGSFVQDGESYLEVRVPVLNRWGSYGRAFPKYGANMVAPVYVLKLMQSATTLGGSYKLIKSGVTPTQVTPDWISERYPARGLFASAHMDGGAYWRASEAARHVYARLYLFDETRALEVTGKSFFVEAVQTNVEAHTAQLRVSFPQRRSPFAPRYYGHGHLVTEDHAWLARYLDNLARCASLRDRVLVDTRNHAVITSGPRRLCSPSLICGAMAARE